MQTDNRVHQINSIYIQYPSINISNINEKFSLMMDPSVHLHLSSFNISSMNEKFGLFPIVVAKAFPFSKLQVYQRIHLQYQQH
jgi:hypothetical protein